MLNGVQHLMQLPHNLTQSFLQVVGQVGARIASMQNPDRFFHLTPDQARGEIHDFFQRTASASTYPTPVDFEDVNRWRVDTRTLADSIVGGLFRVVRPFGKPVVFQHNDVQTSRTFFDCYFMDKINRRVVHVDLERVGWSGDLEIYDSAPELAGREDIVTAIFTHGLTVPGGHAMYADVIRAYLKKLHEEYGENPPVRIIALALPGHGDLEDGHIPSPADFSYHPDAMADVAWAALDKIGASGRMIHATESLGLNLSWNDILKSSIAKKPPRISEHHLIATSPEQMGFLFNALGEPTTFLGNRSVLSAAVEMLPGWVVGYPVMAKLLQAYCGWNAGIGMHYLSMARLRDPRAMQAMFAVLHHLDGYQDGARLMYRAPIEGEKIHLHLLGARDDLVMGETSMKAFRDGLRHNEGYEVSLHMADEGGHFVMGQDKPIRRFHTQLLMDATMRLLR